MRKDQNMDTENKGRYAELIEELQGTGVIPWVQGVVEETGGIAMRGGWVRVNGVAESVREGVIRTLMKEGILRAKWKQYPGWVEELGEDLQRIYERSDGRKYLDVYVQGKGEEVLRGERRLVGEVGGEKFRSVMGETGEFRELRTEQLTPFSSQSTNAIGRLVDRFKERATRARVTYADLAGWVGQGLVEVRRGKRVNSTTGAVEDRIFSEYYREMGVRPGMFEWEVLGGFIKEVLRVEGEKGRVKKTIAHQDLLAKVVKWVRTCEDEVWIRNLEVALTGKKRTRQGLASLSARPPSDSGVSFEVAAEMVEKGLVRLVWPSYPGVRVYKVDGTKNGRRGLTFVQGGIEVDGEVLIEERGLDWVKGEVEKGSLELYKYRAADRRGNLSRLRSKILKDLKGEEGREIWRRQGEMEWKFEWDVLLFVRELEERAINREQGWESWEWGI